MVSLKDVKMLLAQHGHPTLHWTDVAVQQRAHLCMLEPVDVDLGSDSDSDLNDSMLNSLLLRARGASKHSKLSSISSGAASLCSSPCSKAQ